MVIICACYHQHNIHQPFDNTFNISIGSPSHRANVPSAIWPSNILISTFALGFALLTVAANTSPLRWMPVQIQIYSLEMPFSRLLHHVCTVFWKWNHQVFSLYNNPGQRFRQPLIHPRGRPRLLQEAAEVTWAPYVSCQRPSGGSSRFYQLYNQWHFHGACSR